MINENLAPIVLFVYNRPEHTIQTLRALKANYLAEHSRLYVYCDNAKSNASQDVIHRVQKVREIVRMESWCGEVNIVEAESNKGLYLSIRSGVTEILDRYGKVIVMEDDLVTSPAFLDYMNSSLDKYESYPAVFSIGAYSYPNDIMPIPVDYEHDNYLCLRNCSWGWGTWRDKWHLVDWDVNAYDYIRTHPHCMEALNRMGDDEFEMLYGRMSGRLNIWSIQFTITHFKHHAVAMCPTVSYVHNVGLDGSGENCGNHQNLCHKVLNENRNPRLLDIIYEDERLINAFYNVNCRERRPLWQKAINWVARKLKLKPPFVVKKRIYA